MLAASIAAAFAFYPVEGFREALYLASMVSAAVLPTALLSLRPPCFPWLPARAWMVPVLVNLVMLYVLLRHYSIYNNVLLFGAFCVIASRFQALLYQRGDWQVDAAALANNAAIVAAILLAVPHVNGIRITMERIQQPTHIGLYERDGDDYIGTLRNEYFHHVDDMPAHVPQQVHLPSPVAGHLAGEVELLLRPLIPTGFRILEIELLNRIGFDDRLVESLAGERMEAVTEYTGENSGRLAVHDGELVIGPVDNHVWLSIPVDTGYDERARSPAGRGNALRAIVYWQIIWWMCVMLAPFARAAHRPQPA